MATVKCASLRSEFDAWKADIDSHRENGVITEDAYKSITSGYHMMDAMLAILLEKNDQKEQQKLQHPSIPDRQGRNQKASSEEI